MVEAGAIVQGIMAARDKEKINVRWPLKKAVVYLHKNNAAVMDNIKPLVDLILRQTNIKDINFNTVEKTLDEELQGVAFQFGHVVLDTEMTKELEEEGYARELMRRIQSLRKEAGLQKQNEIELYIDIDVGLNKWKKQIEERCGAKTVKFETPKNVKHSVTADVKNKRFEIGFNVVN